MNRKRSTMAILIRPHEWSVDVIDRFFFQRTTVWALQPAVSHLGDLASLSEFVTTAICKLYSHLLHLIYTLFNKEIEFSHALSEGPLEEDTPRVLFLRV